MYIGWKRDTKQMPHQRHITLDFTVHLLANLALHITDSCTERYGHLTDAAPSCYIMLDRNSTAATQ